jgi:predicted SnoaL-like aldol condensation-catalyzing enzyme
MTAETKSIGLRMYEAFNARDLSNLNAVLAEDFVSHPLGTTGIAPVAQAWSGLFAACPDIRVTVEDMLVDGDKVAVRSLPHGVPGGEREAAPAMMEIFRVRQGRIAELWGVSALGRRSG